MRVALKDIKGLQTVDVSLERGEAVATFAPGALAMFIAASSVFVGAVPLAGVAAAKSCEHVVLEALFEITQALSTFDRVLIRVVGALPVEGNDAPGAFPVAGFTRLSAVSAAKPMPLVFVAVAPICAPLAMKGAMAAAVAMVVASSMKMPVPSFIAEQVPSTDDIVIATFEAPEEVAEPPRATR